MAMPDTRLFHGPSPDRPVWTVADLERLPDDGHRYEILHGELLVTPLPSTAHQRIAMRLTVLMVLWCRAHTGWTVLAPGGVYVSETTWMAPDLAVYAVPESADLSWREMPPPLLVVEILSRSTTRRDRHRKRPAYLAHGVAEVWTIDAPRRTIEWWTRASEFPETHGDGIMWMPDVALAPSVVTAQELFGPLVVPG